MTTIVEALGSNSGSSAASATRETPSSQSSLADIVTKYGGECGAVTATGAFRAGAAR
jgi:hypothetical protein